MKKIYLDYASTTPVDPRVLEAMLPYFGVSKLPTTNYSLLTNLFGNPGSLHSFGQEASAAVFKARQAVAAELGCHYSEVVFTGSATEANNLALRGTVEAWQRLGNKGKPRVIISAIEHESVYEVLNMLSMTHGVDPVFIKVSKQGVVDLKALQRALTAETVLVSVMYANNETGVVQPIAQIAKEVRAYRLELESRSRKNTNTKTFTSNLSPLTYPLLHTDASQALQYLDCNVARLGVDLMTISSQKIYGPKGAGALYVPNKERLARGGVTNRDIFPLDPLFAGGGQERQLRSGTENVPAIVGFAKAVELAAAVREKESRRVAALRNELWKGIKKIFPKAVLNGPILTINYKLSTINSFHRLPNNLNFYIPGISGEQMLVALDLVGIAVSSGSACTARSIDPSHVLLAMGFDKVRAKNSIRITLGRPTTMSEVKAALAAFKSVIS